MTKAIWTASGDRSRRGPHFLTTSESPLRLPREDGGSVYLSATHMFAYERSGIFNGEWKVKTLQYVYALGMGPRQDDAFVAWHWHPDKRDECHMHIYLEEEDLGPLRKHHFPTSRVSFESVLRFAITDLGVRATPNWEAVLDESQARFDAFKTWAGARRPPDGKG